MHVPKEHRLKLDFKTSPCVFVGYGDEEFGYRLYDPAKKRVVRSRDVVFYEHEMGFHLLGAGNTYYPDLSHDAIDMSHVFVPDVQQTGDAPDDGHENTHEHDRIEEVQPEIVPQPDDEAVETESGEFSNQEEQNSPQVEEPILRRSTRVRQPSRLYPSSEYILLTDEGEPESLKEVLSHPDKDHWLKAMQEEMNSLKKNQTYDLVKRE
ncbi:unnamed protein product [Cuscuta campestris]|uniref:Retroviral polymerase SH3-like domain-containing protein n=1 Tax=Cuscuta campestris TaxID=132261 RepID=A0A484MUI4_9ASTE|nr:unnamed protein product [Cuscuta campestris]